MQHHALPVLASAAAALLCGCASVTGSKAPPVQFAGRLLIAVPEAQGRSIAQYRSAPSDTDAQWRFDTLRAGSAAARGGGRTWVVATPARTAKAAPRDRTNPWDAAHQLLDGNGGERYGSLLTELGRAAGGDVKPVAVEPDMFYQDARRPSGWYRKQQNDAYVSTTEGNTVTVCDSSSFHWPKGHEFGWHMGDAYSQLRSAREFVRQNCPPRDAASRIRIGIIDTGYNEGHVANPPGLNRQASRDFTSDPANPAVGAVDPYHTGLLTMPGHGCGVVSVLAGGRIRVPGTEFDDYLGGAPDMEVVVMRVSDSVIHLAPVTMAYAIKYATEIGCDVVSISHGGLPCQLLADAVNEAYENGTAIFAAAGDFYRLPFIGVASPQKTVYPAAFSRVVSVCGVTADGRTYSQAPSVLTLLTFRNWSDWMLRGSYGPNSVMDEAIAAYTPNIPWARYAKDAPANLLDAGGSGTSVATPQVSAAAALWLQAHRDDPRLAGKWRSWEKTEAVYQAILDSAQRKTGEHGDTYKYFGNGILKARRALDLGVPPKMKLRPEARVGWGWLQLWGGFLIGVRDANAGQPDERTRQHGAMFDTELSQIVHGSAALQDLVEDLKLDTLREKAPIASVKLFMEAAAKEKNCSNALRKVLLARAAELR